MIDTPLSPNRLSLLDAADQISDGTLTPEMLLEACLERINAREDDVGAWMHLNRDTSRALAKAPVAGPLSGLPIGIKDLIDTADMPTGYGSPIYTNHRPPQDATCVAMIRNAGGIVLGKTVSTEFAYFQPGKTTNPPRCIQNPRWLFKRVGCRSCRFPCACGLGHTNRRIDYSPCLILWGRRI